MILDALLAAVIALAAGSTLAFRTLGSVVGVIVLSGACAAAWLRLGAPIVAVTEATLGVAAVGFLLWRGAHAAADAESRDASDPTGFVGRFASGSLCVAVAFVIVAALGTSFRSQPMAAGAFVAIACGMYGAIVQRQALRRVVAVRTIVCAAMLTLGIASHDPAGMATMRVDGESVADSAQAIAVAAIAISFAGVGVTTQLLRRLIDGDGTTHVDEAEASS